MPEANITITTELEPEVAYQLAQFCKRSCFNDFYDLTEAHLSVEERKERAYKMIAGINSIAKSLSEQGIAPR